MALRAHCERTRSTVLNQVAQRCVYLYRSCPYRACPLSRFDRLFSNCLNERRNPRAVRINDDPSGHRTHRPARQSRFTLLCCAEKHAFFPSLSLPRQLDYAGLSLILRVVHLFSPHSDRTSPSFFLVLPRAGSDSFGFSSSVQPEP